MGFLTNSTADGGAQCHGKEEKEERKESWGLPQASMGLRCRFSLGTSKGGCSFNERKEGEIKLEDYR